MEKICDKYFSIRKFGQLKNQADIIVSSNNISQGKNSGSQVVFINSELFIDYDDIFILYHPA